MSVAIDANIMADLSRSASNSDRSRSWRAPIAPRQARLDAAEAKLAKLEAAEAAKAWVDADAAPVGTADSDEM